MKDKILLVMLAGLAVVAVRAQEISFDPFGLHGEGGTKNGQTIRIGSGGSVFELDAFLNLGGRDLNGGGATNGTAAQLSRDVLPAGLSFTFSPQLTPDKDLVLKYVFGNAGATVFTNVQFFFLLDAEIDQEVNTFFNEHGTRTGVLGQGAADVEVDQWQIDEPGFVPGSTLFGNLFKGALNNSNSIPSGASNDVALALGFAVGDLQPGSTVGVFLEISARGNSLGKFKLVQSDNAAGSATTVTLSGLVATLAGTIFQDANTNGSPDTGEGLPNVTLRLLVGTNLVSQATTDSSGNYSFSTPPAGTYTLAVDVGTLPAGLINTVDPDGTPDNRTTTVVVPGELNIKNWGYRTQVLKGLVFQDANNSGAPEAGEPGLAGVKLFLVSTNDVVVGEATTDAGGNYNFSAPPTGSFTLKVDPSTLPSGLINTVDPDGTADNLTAVILTPGGTTIRNWGYRVPLVGGLAEITGLVNWSFGPWQLNRATGNLYSTLRITNPAVSGRSFGPPFQLGLTPSSSFKFLPANIAGTNDGVPYVNLAAVSLQLGGGLLTPGGSVTNLVEIFSLTRTPPLPAQFKLWATQP